MSLNDTVRGAPFLVPLLWRVAEGHQGWKNYFALVAQVNSTPRWGGETMARHFDPVIHRLIAVVPRALPQASEEELFWAYHMLSGSLTLTLSETGRLDRLSDGRCRSDDIASIGPRLVAYAAAGFRELALANAGTMAVSRNTVSG